MFFAVNNVLSEEGAPTFVVSVLPKIATPWLEPVNG